ncbi:DUF1194 domain-containing protein [Pseudooctadecabacter jejudonensis]|uniref:VWFA domain-containing protein n=1 Tax=Pseudooctadecabacter jejudonensis TaxID=1391910 RepID=A0A1Y5RQ84_9RHOB|nr:DUF1194 domain-containing protein [Pseudooctadecabacter jejudonensis]SLN21745.1 hypothetical protein PSJ8397_00846 [Pseudooctadecabacter jejudonensis]
MAATPAQACRLALVLAMDVSNSVDADEDALQRQGLATALIAPAVRDAFLASDQPVALTVYEWSGRHHQRMMLDWTMIDSEVALQAAAQKVATTPRFYYEFPTAIGYALGHAASLLDTAPVCDAQTIDVSGDGVNNDGFSAHEAVAVFGLDDVTINGLVIDVPEDAILRQGQLDLVSYYAQNVISGPGAFIEVAAGFEDFARAMEMKLIRELGVIMVGQAAPAEAAVKQ